MITARPENDHAADSGRSSRLVRTVEWYQRGREGHPSPCRFTPSCSAYVKDALVTHGTRRGLWLTVRRLARCRPFGSSGFDPIPDAPLPAAHGPHSCPEGSMSP